MDNKEALEIFEAAVSPSRAILRPLGMWPDDDRKKWWRRYICFVSIFMMFYFSTFTQTIMLTKIWGDFNSVIDILTTIDLPVTVVILKTSTFWYNGDVLNELLESMAMDWKKARTSKELKSMIQNAKLGRLISLVIIVTTSGSMLTQFFTTLSMTIAENKRLNLEANGSDIIKPLFIRAEFFFNVQKSPIYELTWALQDLTSIIAGSTFVAVDAFFAVIVLHLAAQLTNLKQLLIDLPEKKNQGEKSFVKLLSMIVARHKYLAKFAESIEDTFNITFLAQMISSSLALCLQGFQVVKLTTQGEIEIFEIIFRVYFGLCFVFSLFIYCYIADVLRQKSMEVGDAAYESMWYNLRPEETKLLIMVINRAKKPFEITAGKFAVFSLELYCQILKSCGGYLSVLVAVKDRLID